MSNEQITQETVPVDQATTETTQPTATPTTVAKTDTPTSSWKDSISEEYRVDPSIEKFTEIDALAKSYINATRMIGQDKIVIPTKNSTQEAWDEAKKVLADLEKRCHYHSTTNVKGDSHESAYMEGQRSVILFIKSMLRKDKDK